MQIKDFNRMHGLMSAHGDKDHINEATYICQNIFVKNITINNGNINDIEKELLKFDRNIAINFHYLKIKNIISQDFNDENDNSIVTHLGVNNFNFLFMGDASIKTEQELIDNSLIKSVDILKVGHHGSKTSTSSAFLTVANPKYAIISSGRNNRFNHPSFEIITRLKQNNIQFFNTQDFGTITWQSSGPNNYHFSFNPP